jgi:hypothetical protein
MNNTHYCKVFNGFVRFKTKKLNGKTYLVGTYLNE